MKAEQLLSEAISHLPDGFTLNVTLNPLQTKAESRASLTGPDGEQVAFALVVKPIHRMASLGGMDSAAGTVPRLLICNRLTPALAAYCREKNINFIDSAGNMHIRVPGLYVAVEGKREKKPVVAGGRFPEGVMKLLFVVLSDPTALNATYRQLAERAGISLGMVSKAFDTLEGQRYYRHAKSGRRLMNTEELNALWIREYAGALKPRLDQLTLEAPSSWAALAPAEGEYLGGELAAARLSGGYLIPESGILYTPCPLLERRNALALKPARAGQLQLIARFWGSYTLTPQAEAMLCLADLLGNGDDRSRDVARIINGNTLNLNESALFGY